MFDSCLYHGDKSLFDQIEKDLKTSKWISRGYVHRLAMAVCECRKNKKAQEPSIKDLEKWQKEVLLFIDARHCDDHCAITPRFKLFILECIKLVNVTDYCRCRFLEILYNASVKDFSLLNRAAVSSNEPVVDETKAVKKAQPLSPEQVKFIVNRRKKKMTRHVIRIPMFPGYIRSMGAHLGTSLCGFAKNNVEAHLGISLYRYASNYKDCYLEWEEHMNQESIENNRRATFVQIWTKDDTCYKTVSGKLIKHGTAAQTLADQKYKRKQERKRQRREHEKMDIKYVELDKWLEWDDYDMDITVDSSARRQGKNRTAKKTSKKDKYNTVSPIVVTSMLDGGHCLHCLKSYTTLSDTSVCQYHSGYVVSNQDKLIWNCCEQSCGDLHATAEQHLDTGCTCADKHTWRPRARRFGKVFDTTNTKGHMKKRVVKHKY